MTTWVQWQECDFQPHIDNFGCSEYHDLGVRSLWGVNQRPQMLQKSMMHRCMLQFLRWKPHLTWNSTSPTAWRWRSRVWSSLLSSPFLLVNIGKYSASLTQGSNILHYSASWKVTKSTGSPVLPMEALVWPQGNLSSASTRRCSMWLHLQELHGISTQCRQTHSFSLGYV